MLGKTISPNNRELKQTMTMMQQERQQTKSLMSTTMAVQALIFLHFFAILCKKVNVK